MTRSFRCRRSFLPLGAKAGAVVALALLTMAASGIWSLHAPFYSWPSDFLSREAAAIAFSLVKTLGSCGGFIGPFAIGAIADEEDFAVAILFLAVALVPAIFLILGETQAHLSVNLLYHALPLAHCTICPSQDSTPKQRRTI